MKFNKKGQAGTIITILITSIIGVALLSVLSGFLTPSLDQNVELDERQTLTVGSNVSLNNDWVVSVDEVTVDNGTNTTLDPSNYTVYQLDDRDNPALIELVETSHDGNTTFVDYTWNPENYITSGTTRILIGFSPLLFGLAIFVFVAGFLITRR